MQKIQSITRLIVLEQMTRKNWSITWKKNSKLHRCVNNYKTVPERIFSSIILVLISRPFLMKQHIL